MAQAVSELASDVPSLRKSSRVEGVDILRGLVMVVMVLDHTRDYFGDMSVDPTDMERASPALFLTRWVTHFCAPTFAMLAGVGARLAGERGLNSKGLAWFLLMRGFWLIFLEQTVEKFGLFFRFDPWRLVGIVLWSIGGSFVLLSAFVAARVPARVVGAIGLAILAGHNLLDSLSPDAFGSLQPLVNVLLRRGPIELPGGFYGFILYPLLPWFGVVAVGYGLGGLYRLDVQRRRAALAMIGMAAIGLFVALRASNLYGDPRPWSAGEGGPTTVLSFVNCTKYPPSLLFLLMTLGPALLALAAFDQGVGAVGKPLATLGRVPLFYYLLQWYVIHGLALATALVRGEPTAWLFIDSFPVKPPPSSTFSLPMVYAWWLVALVVLYVPCAWFDAYKRRHRGSRWLSYL